MRSIFLAISLALVSSPAAAETPFSLLRSGYQILWEGYGQVLTCAPDAPIKLGPYIVVCDSYSYPYHYGDVLLFARSFEYKRKSVLIGYICKGEDDSDCDSLSAIYSQ